MGLFRRGRRAAPRPGPGSGGQRIVARPTLEPKLPLAKPKRQITGPAPTTGETIVVHAATAIIVLDPNTAAQVIDGKDLAVVSGSEPSTRDGDQAKSTNR